MAKKTFSAPFLHYQIQHLITSRGEAHEAKHLPFIPMGGEGFAHVPINDGSVISIVYNLYLYDEHAVFIESFAHEFKPRAHVAMFQMQCDLTDREIADVFPNINHLSEQAAALTVWQFAD